VVVWGMNVAREARDRPCVFCVKLLPVLCGAGLVWLEPVVSRWLAGG
jgi:hypothetical protein